MNEGPMAAAFVWTATETELRRTGGPMMNRAAASAAARLAKQPPTPRSHLGDVSTTTHQSAVLLAYIPEEARTPHGAS